MLNWSPGYKIKLQILSVKALISMIGKQLMLSQYLSDILGTYSVDSFAGNFNKKVPTFNSKYSCPNTSQVDACRVIWGNENNYLVPPTFYLILRVMKHLAKSKSHGTLILPHWPSASFLPFL